MRARLLFETFVVCHYGNRSQLLCVTFPSCVNSSRACTKQAVMHADANIMSRCAASCWSIWYIEYTKKLKLHQIC